MTDMSNEEYHNLLDARNKALKDFRYVNIDEGGARFEVEAYQIDGRSRTQIDDWPPWLVMQRAISQTNAVFADTDSPNTLVLMKSDGLEQPLGKTDWLVLYKTGDIDAVADKNFQHFDKVVPVPARPEPGEELPDFEKMFEVNEKNQLVPRTTPLPEPTPGIDDLIESGGLPEAQECFPVPLATFEIEIEVLRTQMKIAIGCLMGGASKGAIKASQHLEIGLETAKDGGLEWCNCAPGSCDESTKWGCRQKSPLL